MTTLENVILTLLTGEYNVVEENMPKASVIFGELTFNKKAMREKLNQDVFEKLIATIESGMPLDLSIAADVAHAMKEWAIENGATHFTHWFQPQRGGTAEKHDAFINYSENNEIIERFSASQLIQSEPDASSFPSGGMRSTFEARGYTAWDPTSPAFLLEAQNTKTLVIPSVFLSWTGAVLDIKTPLLRSEKALNDVVIKLLRLLGNRSTKRIKIYLGAEQEYFLVNRKFYNSRPDLQNCGRTIFGAPPAKGQQMEDHYFGAIKEKVLDFMEAFDNELYRRGIPAKTRHNEVAPNQFEIAPLYEIANLANDHNLQLMDILKRIARKFDMEALLHEKPFAGVNGSGKHVNWSIGDDNGANFLEPSKSPLKNISFLMTIGAILLGVNKFGGLLRAAVADAGNDHRLGANEAPPAIMSVYLGEYLNGILNEIEGIGEKPTDKQLAHINLGVQNLPRVAKDISDRNRTSPVAFTGNKFEFRACGSSQNIAEPVTILNLIVAYGYDEIYNRLKNKHGDIKAHAVVVLKDILKETKRVRFEGNNYALDWHKEAEQRGLPNVKDTSKALELFLEKSAVELFKNYRVLTDRELESKIEIKLEAYIKVKDIEFKTGINMVKTMVLPSLLRHITQVAGAAAAINSAGVSSASLKQEVTMLEKLFSKIKTCVGELEQILTECENISDIHKQAHLYAEKASEKLSALRAVVDSAEELVADDLWPLAKYQQILNIL
ncbi:MAG: glutamine synthetase III [Spirochaetales bacterium]|nr:glutamine synthetase III [Spirochaetales bacterium]